ncbi:hypothetical protein [Butyrivibrio sp. VCD2006]|uniref:hypothetical protein n=1 Tax=Butyrivibrio sp. VCD2006 TaxID=1280664 RepID=UPI000424CE92|nr:hypothetical protein [Butyrivibrio sp. VCD2006]
MYYYEIYGLKIVTDYELEEAIGKEPFDASDVTVLMDKEHNTAYDMTEADKEFEGYFYHYEPAMGWIRYPNQGAFIIENGNSIKYKLYDGYNRLLINEIILCLALPIVIVQRQQLMLHGSGLVVNDKCLILSGKSGAGKSTLTNELIRHGAKFLADDTVALEVDDDVYAYPAYPQQKLCLDQISEELKKECTMVLLPEDDGVAKYGVRDRNRFYDHKIKVDMFVVINPTDDVSEPVLQQIVGADAMGLVLNNIYQRGAFKKVGMSPELFQKCITVAKEVKVYKLSRPRNGMTTKEQVKLIMENL